MVYIQIPRKTRGNTGKRCFRFFGQTRVAVVYSSVTGKIAIMSILRAFALSAYKKPETSFYTMFYNDVCPFKISEFQVVWSFTG